jgi:hypothetical protein
MARAAREEREGEDPHENERGEEMDPAQDGGRPAHSDPFFVSAITMITTSTPADQRHAGRDQGHGERAHRRVPQGTAVIGDRAGRHEGEGGDEDGGEAAGHRHAIIMKPLAWPPLALDFARHCSTPATR